MDENRKGNIVKTCVCIFTLLAVSAALAEAPHPPSSVIAGDAWYPRSTDTYPTDVAKSHVEEISEGIHKNTVFQGGTMDGRNCRSPMGCGIAREGAFLHIWESNRSVRIEKLVAYNSPKLILKPALSIVNVFVV